MPKVKSESGVKKESKASLDCSNRQRKFWLVKVPKYVSEDWQARGPNAVVGKLKVGQEIVFESVGGVGGTSAAAPSTSASLPVKAEPTASNVKSGSKAAMLRQKAAGEAMQALGKTGGGSSGATERPKEHKFLVSGMGPQCVAVYSEDQRGVVAPDEESGRLRLEGTVVKRAELRPPSNLDYLRMKAKAFEAAAKPTRSIVSLDRHVNKFNPVNMHKEDMARDKAKRAGETRMIRLDRDRMMAAIFAAFERHQYYKLTDLAAVVAQPQNYVREVLNEVGQYSDAPPHKNMWQLKEEYRHYKGMEQ